MVRGPHDHRQQGRVLPASREGGDELIQQDAVGKRVAVKLPKYTKNPDSNFVDCILGKDVPQTPPECGLRTIEVTEAAWKSAASRQTGQVLR